MGCRMGCITQVSPFPISGHSNPILTELLEICYVQTSLYHADTSDCFVYFSLSLTLKPMYDTIWQLFLILCVRYQSLSHAYYDT